MSNANSSFSFISRVQIEAGPGVVRTLPEKLAKRGWRRVGLFVDGGLLDGFAPLSQVIAALDDAAETLIVEEYRQPFEPTYAYLDRVRQRFAGAEGPLVDCIVGIGGGSTVDTAKGIAMLSTNPLPALEYRGFPVDLQPSLPIVAVPSTAGTGSEAAYYAVFTDDEQGVKFGINTPNNYPELALLDPELVAAAPQAVWASGAADAFVHTIEAFSSPKATPMSDAMARASFQFLFEAVRGVLADRSDMASWGRMQYGATVAMLALSNSSSGPSGALSYHLGVEYNVPHGFAGGVFLPGILRLNQASGFHAYADLLPAIGRPASGDRAQDSAAVVAATASLLADIGVPDNLGVFAITGDSVDKFVEFSKSAAAAFELNAVPIGETELRGILKDLL